MTISDRSVPGRYHLRRVVRRVARAHRRREEVSRSLPPLVHGVLAAVSSSDMSRDERRWAGQIEERRARLLGSTRVVRYRDFGAGLPDRIPSGEETLAGRAGSQSLGRLTKVASKDRHWAGFLMRLVRETRPVRCVEMGAAVGISAAYQAAALTINGDGGRLTTLEGGEPLAAVTRETLDGLGLSGVADVVQGRFADTLTGVLADGAPDYVFVDGHHDGRATVDYFGQIAAVMGRGVVVLDDIDWSASMRRAWQEVRDHEDVTLSVDLRRMGVCVLGEPGWRLRVDAA